MATSTWTNALSQDIRYGIRLMLKTPRVTAVAVITLALAIGVNTAIFSVVNAVLLRQLPYANSERLVLLWEKFLQQGLDRIPVSASEFVDYQNQAKSFDQVAAFATSDFNLTGLDTPERVSGALVSSSLFPLLGIRPIAGRAFLPHENELGNDNVVILGHSLWKRRFGGNPKVIDTTIRIDSQNCTVIGIMPAGFSFPMSFAGVKGITYTQPPEMWRPLAFTADQLKQRGGRYLGVIGQLKSDVTMAQAQAEVQSIADEMLERYPNNYLPEGWGADLYPLQEQAIGTIRPALLVLFGSVGLVLLIACANVANLMLTRMSSRQREITLRAALGASRSRIVRQLLTESALLAMLGAIGGLLTSRFVIGFLVLYSPDILPRMREITLDMRTLLFAFALSGLTTVIFGLIPALYASRTDLSSTLKTGGITVSASKVSNRLRYMAVIAELALSCVLLIGAGLTIKSLWRLLLVDPGFESKEALTFQITLPQTKYPDEASASTFYQQAISRITTLPGVVSAGAANVLPLSGSNTDTAFFIEGRIPSDLSLIPDEEFRIVTSDYFRAMGIPLLQGRFFTESDQIKEPGVVIVNQSFVGRYFPDEEPIGKRITLDDPRRPTAKWITIVGVVGDVKHRGLNEPARPEFYVPHLQFPDSSMTLVTRVQGDPLNLAPSIRAEIAGIDKELPIYNVRTIEEILSESLTQQRLLSFLLGIFAWLALTLALIGIYGIVSYAVTQRTQEIGIRMSLGAETRDILNMFMKLVMKLAVTGIGLGLIISVLLARAIKSLLFEVSVTDPTSFAAIGLILLATAALACYIPARRATKLSPMVALRYD